MSWIYFDCHEIYECIIVWLLLTTSKDYAYNNLCSYVGKTCSVNFEDNEIPSNTGLLSIVILLKYWLRQ